MTTPEIFAEPPHRKGEALTERVHKPEFERVPMVRDVLLHKESDMYQRVLQVSARDFHIMPLGRGADKAWPERRHGSLLKLVNEHEYLYLPSYERDNRKNTAGALPSGYRLFCDAFADVQRLLTPAARYGLYIELLKERPRLSTSLFYRLARRWLQGGMTPESLKAKVSPPRRARLETDEAELLKMSLSAARDAVRRQCERLMAKSMALPPSPDYRSNDGQPRKRKAPAQPSMFRVDGAVLRLFLSYFDAKLTKGPAKSLPAIYESMLQKEFSVAQPLGVAEPFPGYVVPSFKAFEFWYYRLTDFRQRRIAAKGSHDFDLNGRAKLGQQVTTVYAAGEAAQIDATVWNVGVVTKKERIFAGFPVVFRIRCVNTGRCLGIGVSLESASWLGAASAIANCLVDKRTFCRRYGLDIDAFEWDGPGLPPILIADCGETYNSRPTRFIERTGTEVVNVKPGRGDLKGGVESDFRTLQIAFNGKTPAAIIAEHEERTGKKWAVKTTMDLDQFTAVLLAIELKRMKEPRKRTQQMRSIAAAGVSTAPNDLWNYLVATNGCALRSFDLAEVQLSLMEVARASITPEGLYFQGLLYREDQLAATHAFARARRSGRKAVAIAYDKRLVDHIFLIRGDEACPRGYIQCDLAERVDQRGYRGMTFREVGTLQEAQVQASNSQRMAEKIRLRQLDDFIESVADGSVQQTRQAREATPITDRALLDGMAEARREEANRTSPSQALVPEMGHAPPAPVGPHGETCTAAPVALLIQDADDLVFYDEELAAFDRTNLEASRV